jgi:hypothetical protein
MYPGAYCGNYCNILRVHGRCSQYEAVIYWPRPVTPQYGNMNRIYHKFHPHLPRKLYKGLCWTSRRSVRLRRSSAAPHQVRSPLRYPGNGFNLVSMNSVSNKPPNNFSKNTYQSFLCDILPFAPGKWSECMTAKSVRQFAYFISVFTWQIWLKFEARGHHCNMSG